jgi:two-component system cell cycle sensor histidine kinase/response regulator CckA
MIALHTAEARGGNETVLLVEPDPETRALAAFMLGRLGYSVVEAHNGLEASQLYDEHGGAIDLLVTEAIMSRVDGHDLAESLRGRKPGLRILFMADLQYARLTRRVAAQKKMMFLARPFTIAQLAAKVREALDTPGVRIAGAT